jgi:hypothetical protein
MATPPSVKGTIDSVPCPHCGTKNDFRPLKEQQLLDVGDSHFCDYCGRSMVIAGIQTVTWVAVRQDPSGKVYQGSQGQQAQAQRRRQLQQQQPKSFLQKLLGK